MVTSAVVDHSAPESSDPTPSPQRRHVTLRGLFRCTTYFAISSVLATKFGLGIFMLMNGVFLTWLSFRGYLWWMQTNSARPKVYGIAWLLFAVSFGLPALTVPGCGTTPPETRYGWQAALMTVAVVQGTYEEAETFVRDPGQRTAENGWELFASFWLVILWNLPNLLMLASPFVLFRQQQGKGQVLSMLFNCAAVSSWTWGIVEDADLRIGYYVWSSGITAIALARQSGWRSLAAMGALGTLWLLVAILQ